MSDSKALDSASAHSDPEVGRQTSPGSPALADKTMEADPLPIASSPAPQLQDVDGWRAWLVVVGAFISLFMSLGSLYGFGIWIAEYQLTYPDVGTGQIALVGTIGLGLFFFLGLFSGPLSDRYGPRRVMFVGTVLWTLGFALAGASTKFWQTMLSHGVLVGVGASLCYWPAITTVPQWFRKYSATGTAIAALGSGLGNLFFALAGNKIITSLGFRNALFLIAGLGFALLCLTVVLIDRRIPPVRKGRLFAAAIAMLPLRNYRIMLLSTFFFQFGFFVPFVHISPYCVDAGFTTEDGALALAMLGIGSSVGRIVFGPVADKVGKMFTLRWCVVAGGVAMMCWPSLKSLNAILAFAFIYGAFGGGFIALSPSACAQLFGVARLGGVFSLLNLAMVPGAFASSPLAGLARDATGSYDAAVYPAASLLMISGFLFFLIREDESLDELGDVKTKDAVKVDQEAPANNENGTHSEGETQDKKKVDEGIQTV